MEVSQECEKAFVKAKIGLMTSANTCPDLAFLSSLMLGMRFSWTKDLPTAATDGKELLINPDFWMDKCDEHTRKGLIAHEVFHGALLHTFRRGTRDPKIWNYACDYIVNDMCLALGLQLPPTDLINKKYSGWTTEAVYDDLVKNNPPPPQTSYGDDILDGSDSSGTNQAEVEGMVAQAHQTAKMLSNSTEAGYASSELNRLMKELFEPVLPWNKLLRKFATVFKREDYSTKRFNRRFMPRFYLPTLYSEAFPDINVYIDTSGSVSDKDFTSFLSECQGIRKMLKPKKMRFYSWDTALYDPQVLTKSEPIVKVKMKGGGGTEVKPVLEDIAEIKPEISIIFTDGYFSKRTKEMEEAAKATNLLWLIYDNPNWNTKHGTVIHFKKSS